MNEKENNSDIKQRIVQYHPNNTNQAHIFERKEQNEILEQTTNRSALIAVIFCWVFGVLFAEIFLKGGFGLSIPLLVSIFYSIAFWYIRSKQPNKISYILLIPIALISIGFLVNDNFFIYFINTLMLIALIPLQLTIMSGTSKGTVLSLQSIYHTLVSTIVRPLGFIDAPFRAIFKNIGKDRLNSKYTMIIIGLVIAFPITVIFFALFMKADIAFSYFANQILKNIKISPIDIFIDVFFGTFVAIFMSAWFITLRARNAPEEKQIKLKSGLNSTIITTLLIALNFVQVSFVAVQFRYLFAKMKLPDNTTYANYARSGFFELCAVVFISVVIIAICMAFVKRNEKEKLPHIVSSMLTLFIACNYVIAASAILRMLTYIKIYDLTVLRVMVTWAIAVFAICLFGTAIKIWIPKYKLCLHIVTSIVILLVFINTLNVNSFVAGYNVNSYLDSLKTSHTRQIDIYYLGTLGPSAANATAKLYDNKYPIMKNVEMALDQQKDSLNHKSWKNFCLTDLKAAEVFKDHNIIGTEKNIENK